MSKILAHAVPYVKSGLFNNVCLMRSNNGFYAIKLQYDMDLSMKESNIAVPFLNVVEGGNGFEV